MSEPTLPSPMDLLMRSFDAFKDDLQGYLLAGVIPMIVTILSAFASIIVVYGSMFVGMLPGLMMNDELVAMLGGMGLFMVALIALVVGIGLAMAPLSASLMRAMEASHSGEAKLTFQAPLSTAKEDLPRVVQVTMLVSTLTFVGAMMCYVPGLLVGFLLCFALPGVVLDRLSVGEAVGRSVGHAREHVGWHAGVFGILMLMYIILSQIPFVGYLVAMTLTSDFTVRAYRAAFPADAQPA